MRLSRREQIVILVLAAIAAIILFGLLPWVWNLVFGAVAPAALEPAPGTFRPTTEQWADLKFARVVPHDFPGLVASDGAIASDDDTTTPVYSPYSGCGPVLYL